MFSLGAQAETIRCRDWNATGKARLASGLTRRCDARVPPIMKSLLCLAGFLLVASALHATAIIVYAKGESAMVDAIAAPDKPADPAKAAFLAAFQADLMHPAPFLEPLKVGDFPVYGRDVPGASGMIRFHESFAGGVVLNVALMGLLPGHRYILTLNGNPKRAGNDRLVDPVPGNEAEKYFDFQTVTTDAMGQFTATFAIALPKGPYDVRFYVKDTDDFKIVLYHDFFKFAVE